MSFFDEYQEGEGGKELASRGAGMFTIGFSGRDGLYSWKDGDARKEAMSIEKVIAFWNLNSRGLWPSSGVIPKDGDAPLCRSENDKLDIAALRPQIGPATRATMKMLGHTGECSSCPLAKFNGDQKPLCKKQASVYVVEPGVPINENALHRITFNGPSVVDAIKKKIENLLRVSKERGVRYAALTVVFGREKLKGRSSGETYFGPTLSISPADPQEAGWLAALGVEASLVFEETRRRPSWAGNHRQMFDDPAVLAALNAARDVEGISVEEIPF